MKAILDEESLKQKQMDVARAILADPLIKAIAECTNKIYFSHRDTVLNSKEQKEVYTLDEMHKQRVEQILSYYNMEEELK